MLVISNRPCASRSSDFEITRAIVVHSVQLILVIIIIIIIIAITIVVIIVILLSWISADLRNHEQ